MCDNGYKVMFNVEGCKIIKSRKVIVEGIRIESNLYNLSEVNVLNCMIGQVDETWLWHRRMGHVNFINIVETHT